MPPGSLTDLARSMSKYNVPWDDADFGAGSDYLPDVNSKPASETPSSDWMQDMIKKLRLGNMPSPQGPTGSGSSGTM